MKASTFRELEVVNENDKDVVFYRKSGLSLNHIIGCPLDCSYCVRHFINNFDMKKPTMICSDEEAVKRLVTHKYFVPNVTPLQLLNSATDPFLKEVKFHTFNVLKLLDSQDIKNHVLIITRYKVEKEDIEELENLNNIRITLLFTYSGMNYSEVEPISKTKITKKSILVAAKYSSKVKVILYLRPIVPGWNDSKDNLINVFSEVGSRVDAIVYSGLYTRDTNLNYMNSIGVSIPYSGSYRRKILPDGLDEKILIAYKESKINTPIFRKTSCGVAFVHKDSDYNGHFGLPSICDICPKEQKDRCEKSHIMPSLSDVESILKSIEWNIPYLITNNKIWVANLTDQQRYFIQHNLNFQVWNYLHPHYENSHGRANIGNVPSENDLNEYAEILPYFNKSI